MAKRGLDAALRAVLLAAAMSILTGCADLMAVHLNERLPNGPNVLTIDAKQRSILSQPFNGDETQAQTFMRFCAEPPPDVFSALAASVSADLSGSIDSSKNRELAAKLGAAISENAATVERSQTVNILRESMYRTCERYLNNAISKDEFIVQAARDQRAMVDVLAIEQLTGVARAQATALTTVAKASASGVTEGSLKILNDAKSAADSAQADAQQAADAATALTPPAGDCSQTLDSANPPSGATADQVKAKADKCTDAKSKAAKAKDAQSYYATVLAAVQKQSDLSAEASGSASSAALTTSEASKELANAVVRIAQLNSEFDEVGMTCVVLLRHDPPNDSAKQGLYNNCLTLVKDLAREHDLRIAARNTVTDDELKTITLKYSARMSELDQDAGVLWRKINTGGKPDAKTLDEVVRKSGTALDADARDALLHAQDLTAFKRVLLALPHDVRRGLADASR